MCGQALKRENVFKPRDICWRKGFCVIRVSAMFVKTKSGEKLYYSCKSSVLHTREKAHLHQGSAAPELGKNQFCQLQRHHWEIGGNELKMRHGLCTERAVSWGDVQGDLTQRFRRVSMQYVTKLLSPQQG